MTVYEVKLRAEILGYVYAPDLESAWNDAGTMLYRTSDGSINYNCFDPTRGHNLVNFKFNRTVNGTFVFVTPTTMVNCMLFNGKLPLETQDSHFGVLNHDLTFYFKPNDIINFNGHKFGDFFITPDYLACWNGYITANRVYKPDGTLAFPNWKK